MPKALPDNSGSPVVESGRQENAASMKNKPRSQDAGVSPANPASHHAKPQSALRRWLVICGLLCLPSLAAAEDGVSDGKIIIGQTAGFSGTVSGPTKEITAGASAYFSHINATGGVHGRRIELKSLDDQYDANKAAANAEKLIVDERVFALFLCRGTPTAQAIMPLSERHKVPLVAPSTGANFLHEPVKRYVFNVRPRYQTEVVKAIEHFSTVGLNRIAVAYPDDSFGQDGMEGFQSGMRKFELKPALVAKYDTKNPDIEATTASLVKADPNALIVLGTAKVTAQLISALRNKGGAMQIMTLSNNSSQAFVDSMGAAGTGILVSQVMPASDSLSTPLGQEFRNIAIARGVVPSYAAMEGFVSAKVMVEGLRRAGRNLTRESFVHAMEAMRKVEMGGVMVSYSENDHSGSEFVELSMIAKSGRFLR